MSEYAISVQADKWRDDQARADNQRDILIASVRAANATGVSEYRIAQAAGVSRQTVRAWLGKGQGR